MWAPPGTSSVPQLTLSSSRLKRLDQLELGRVEDDEAAVGEPRPERDIGMAPVAGIVVAHRADVAEVAGALLDQRVLGDHQGAADLEGFGGEVGGDLHQHAVVLHVAGSDHVGDDGGIVGQHRGHVGPRPRLDHRDDLAVLGADDRDVARRGAGDHRMAVVGGEVDHVRRADAFSREIDPGCFLEVGAVDMDDAGPLVDGPDLVSAILRRAGACRRSQRQPRGQHPRRPEGRKSLDHVEPSLSVPRIGAALYHRLRPGPLRRKGYSAPDCCLR
jgi:hypothetical protein